MHPRTPPRHFSPNGLATLIGSLPVGTPQEALALIFDHTPQIPLWPQLPGNPAEGMLNQFIEGMPGIIEEAERTWFDSEGEAFEAAMLAYYEHYFAAEENPDLLDASPFAVSPSRARGLYAFQQALAGQASAPGTQHSTLAVHAVKGQITGPFTLLTGLHDRQGRAAYYDQTFREMAVKGLAMKAAWQARFLAAAKVPVILFIDEPALAGLGSSAFIGVSVDEIGRDLTELIDASHKAGALAGVHVCANTDWDFLLSLDLDIVSFDAYGFFDRLAACRASLDAFLGRNGILAWGLVPTSATEAIEKESAASLFALWEAQAGQLVGPGRDLPAILRQTLFTPSCGTGSLSLSHALKVLDLTRDLSALARGKYL